MKKPVWFGKEVETGYLMIDGTRIYDGLKKPLSETEKYNDKDVVPHIERKILDFLPNEIEEKGWNNVIPHETAWCEKL